MSKLTRKGVRKEKHFRLREQRSGGGNRKCKSAVEDPLGELKEERIAGGVGGAQRTRREW